MSKFLQLPAYWCSTARAVCTRFKYLRGQMRTTTSNLGTLAHTGLQVTSNIQQETSMSPHAGISLQFAPSQTLPPPIHSGEGGTSPHTGSVDAPTVPSQISIPPQIVDEPPDDDVIISSAREFEQARRNKNPRTNRRRTLDSEGQSTRSSPNNLSKRIRGSSNLEFQQSAMMQPGGGHYLQQHQQAHQMTPQALMAARSSMLYSQQPYYSLQQQQQVLHNQLGMSSGGSSGLHMLHGESGGSGSLGGGFPDFGRGVGGEGLSMAGRGGNKPDIGSSEGRGESSGGHGGDGSETH